MECQLCTRLQSDKPAFKCVGLSLMSCDSITLSPNFLIYKVVLTATTLESDKASPSSLTPPEAALELFTEQQGRKSTSTPNTTF